MVERVQRTIDRYAMAGLDELILVGLSGGPDSTCLLDVLHRLSGKLGFELQVAHVDHGLSESSEDVAARVSSEAAEAGFEVHMVRAPDLAGPNLQARARLFRYSFFETIAAQIGASRIATGHTLDDRVETTLARFIHGAGTEGLAGIPPAEGTRIRPLIEVRRAEARAYCDQVGLTFYDDPANSDDRFERPAVRHQVVAAIEGRWGDGAVRAMAKSADRLNDDATALRSLGDALLPQISTRRGADVVFERRPLEETPRALRRRVLELAVGRVRDRAGGIEAVVSALEGRIEGNRAYAVASGIEIAITADKVVVRHPETTDTEPPA